jgi:cytoskeletal protein CcmA (bactofilin family)
VIFTRFFRRRPQRRRSADQLDAFTSHIGIGTLLEGQIEGKGNYLVEGEVVGDADINGVLVLAAGAYWMGNVTADHVKVGGKIDGNVTARVKMELAPTAMVIGNLASPVIAIAEGAVYEGRINRPTKTQVTRHAERRGNGTSLPPA